MEDAFGFSDLKVDKVLTYSGDIYNCIHVFIVRKYFLETLMNAYFENKICLEKAHPEKVL